MSIDFTPEPQGIDFTPESQMTAQAPAQPQQQPGFLSQLGNGMLQNILGAGDAVRHAEVDALNIPIKIGNYFGANAQQVPFTPSVSNPGTNYNIGNFEGNVGAFMGGGELLDAARAGMATLPGIGKAASYLGGQSFLPGLLRRGIGSTIGGATLQPNTPGAGAIEGGTLSAASDILPPFVKSLTPGVTEFMGQADPFAQSLMKSLGGGQSVEENAQLAAQGINQSYQAQKGQANDIYNSVFDRLPSGATATNASNAQKAQGIVDPKNPQLLRNQPIYPAGRTSDSLVTTFPFSSQKTYFGISEPYQKYFNAKLQDLHNDFEQNPTLQNAHDLQSQLGSQIGKLVNQDSKGNLDQAGQNALHAAAISRNSLQNDMGYFLNRMEPQYGSNLANTYQSGSDFYDANVVPYKSDPILSQIAKGKLKNPIPGQLSTIFQSPEDRVNTIVQHLGPQLKNQILYDKLGQINNLSAKSLWTGAQSLKKGLSSYISPQLNQSFSTLPNLIKSDKNAQTLFNVKEKAADVFKHGIGYGAGAFLSKALGFGDTAGEIAGAGLVGGAFPFITPYLGAGISKLAPLAPAYRPIANATIANMLAPTPQGQGG